MFNKTRSIGALAEDYACTYLRKKGLKLLERNFLCKLGEIDIVMQEKMTLVFVEVRLRNNMDFGNGLESITWHKQQKLIKAAEYYLSLRKQTDQVSCRFDAVQLSPVKQPSSQARGLLRGKIRILPTNCEQKVCDVSHSRNRSKWDLPNPATLSMHSGQFHLEWIKDAFSLS